MAQIKIRISREEQSNYQDYRRLLEEGGCLLGDVPASATPFLRIEQNVDAENFARALFTTGGVVYAIGIRLVICSNRVVLTGCEASTGFEILNILADDDELDSYRFADRQWPRSEVINHCIGRHRLLQRGDIVEGTLLAWGLKTIPSLRSGKAVSVEVAFFDQFSNCVRFPLALGVDFSAMKQTRRRPEGLSLFDEVTYDRTAGTKHVSLPAKRNSRQNATARSETIG